jgi:hypothetical protein
MKTHKRVLILFAHPALQKSRVSRVMIEQVRTISGIQFHDLYEAYPEFDIDVSHDQDLQELALMRHDRKAYLSSARNRIQDLERLLIKEHDGYDETRDMGWDTTTLRQDFANIAAAVEEASSEIK